MPKCSIRSFALNYTNVLSIELPQWYTEDSSSGSNYNTFSLSINTHSIYNSAKVLVDRQPKGSYNAYILKTCAKIID